MAAAGLLVLLGTFLLSHGLPADGEEFACPVSEGVFEHPEDCTSYYLCLDWKPKILKCSAPLHFNRHTKLCDWPLNEVCSRDEYSANYAGQPGPEGAPGPIPEYIVCPADPCDCRVPDCSDCRKFYICINGRPYPQWCAHGLHFNPVTYNCDHPHIAGCIPCPTTPTIPPRTTPTRTTPTRTTPTRTTPTRTTPTRTTPTRTTPTRTTPPPTCPTCPTCPQCIEDEIVAINCTCYKQCINGVFQERCCCPGLNFSIDHLTCGLFPCVQPDCPCKCCLTPDPCDCTKYYICLNGHSTQHQCGEGLAFDPDKQTCVWKKDVPHCCTGPTWTTSRPDRTTPFNPQPPTSSPICRRGDGHYKHPDCKKFYHCSNGIAYVKDCPAGLNWSVKYDRCEWPHIAPCV